MPAQIIDGNELSAQIRSEVKTRTEVFTARHGFAPGLAVVLVGENPASVSYVRGKERDGVEVGFHAETIRRPADITQEQLLGLIHELNRDTRFHGILVQLPLPPHIDADAIVEALDYRKDADCLNSHNVGRLLQGEGKLIPCTPSGVQQMLIRTGHDPAGKHVVICGRSNLVGKPLGALLVQKAVGANATVTLCHTGTKDLPFFTRQADILVAATGVRNSITADMVRDGAVVIDVGINRIESTTTKSGFRLVGDVDYAAVAEKASAITPVPGGVGPMTRAMLLVNTLTAAEMQVG
ncbi:MAG: bifunctional 5,10-methylenetetrahydrofolate dehydrogenase/5,10-methenyltetrahydrofolate cyclohydrolase [Dehalococcoidia bacterium]|nr:bifunctional 5,10-methylenetetrahydrofolate dehydrogenase/5,10-methenyltetrahydrofolate cyclohydrolase [Dehalococcoidia bacterium]